MQHSATGLAKYRGRSLRVALSIMLMIVASLAFSSVALADDATGSDDSLIKTSVADDSTIWNWDTMLGDDTSAVGSIWTDKTISATDMTHDTRTITKGDSDFVTALSTISSTSSLSTTVSQPLDIVLVLDVSKSMGDNKLGNVTRLKALQTAVNSFIDKIAAQNDKISDTSKQHQVALVKFAGVMSEKIGNEFYGGGNYSQQVTALAACTSANKETLKTAVNDLKSGGVTNSNAGLALANQITSERTDAKKIVIFFTDGKPTAEGAGGIWDDELASSSVEGAQTMKNAGVTIYTVGVLDGADPSTNPTAGVVTDEKTMMNNFMHAVSSNYSKSAYPQNTKSRPPYYYWVFGDRTANSDYYKIASDQAGLEQVFDDIASEITTSTGYPTKTIEGLENESGYITFDDELGAYMKVDEVKAIAYNGAKYDKYTKSTKDNVTTYTFAGDANAGLDATENLKDIVITVTTSDKVSDGDKVQVKIPATMIPLTSYDIDLTANTMAKKAAEPLSVFYTSSLKDEVADLLKNPDEDMQAYLSDESHIDDETGEVYFYANKWSGEANGDVTASYEPAATNSYYYFTADAPIYTDEACTTRATSVEPGTTYYYQQNYYKMTDGKPVATTASVAFPGAAAAGFEGAVAKDADGNAYFTAGTARLNTNNQLNLDKAEGANKSETASSAVNIQWSSTTKTSEATKVAAQLGNNGRLGVKIPTSTLEISKQLTIPEGYDAADFADVEFGFTVNIPEAAEQSFSAQVYDAQGKAVGDAFTLAFDKDGKATCTLKADQKLSISGLTGGWKYTVSEDALDGYTQISPADETGAATEAKGELTTGETAQAEFENRYSTPPVEYDTVNMGLKKVLTGRDWLDTDSFSFTLKALDDDAPLPVDEETGEPVTNVTVTKDNADSFDFGTITFTQEMLIDSEDYTKTFTYEVTEDAGNIAGITYATNTATLKVTVKDNLAGKLTVTAVCDDAVFTNTYTADPVEYNTADLGLNKVLTGRDWLDTDSFTFTLKALDGGPLPVDADGNEVTSVTVTQENASAFDFGTMTFKQEMLEGSEGATKTFTYEVTEDEGDIEGITYATNTATFTVTVKDDLAGKLTVSAEIDDPTFTNTYAEEPADDPDEDTPDKEKSKSKKDAIAKTGDNSLALGVGIGIIALAAGAVVLVARNRRHA